jgi:two-component system, cell cycle sensor histidine kinase and response regulator CckA
VSDASARHFVFVLFKDRPVELQIENTMKIKTPSATAEPVLSRAAGKIAIAVGLLVLAGWFFDIDVLKRISSRSGEMNPITAICFVLVGVSFECFRASKPSKLVRVVGIALALLVGFVGAVKAGSYVHSRPLRIDALLFGLTLEKTAQRIPTEMAPNTALNLIYLGLALCVIDAPPRRFPISHVLAIFVNATALLALMGYAYGVTQFTRVSSLFIPMSLPTAFTFFILSAGVLLLRTDTAFAQIFAVQSPAQAVALRLLPAATIFIFLAGWLRLYGERNGYFPGAIGTAIFAVTMIFGLGALIWWTAASLNRADQARMAAERELKRSRAELQASMKDLELLMNHASELICSIDDSGRVISINAASVPLLGAEPEKMIGNSFADFVHPDDSPQWKSACLQAQTGSVDVAVTSRLRRRDETFATIGWSLRWSRYYRRLFGVGRLEGSAGSLRPWG